MKSRIRLLIGCVLLALGVSTVFGGCSTAHDPWEDVTGEGPHVLTSFTPLYCFAKEVAGDHGKVICLLTTVGPHDYSPTAEDALAAHKADLFFVNGLELDSFVATIKNSSGNSKLKVIELGDQINHDLLLHYGDHGHDHEDGNPGPPPALPKDLEKSKKADETESSDDCHHGDEDGDHKHDDGHHHHGEHDPHVWLGIKQAKAMVEVIRDELIKAAPKYKKHYEKNAQVFLKKLDELYEYGEKKLGHNHPRIIATHDSLGYFAQTFHIDIVGNLMPQPNVEPDAATLKKLIEVCTDTKNPVRVITVEPQYSDKVAQTLVAQIKSKVKDAKQVPKVVPFDTLETGPRNLQADYYLTKMRENIDELAKGLK